MVFKPRRFKLYCPTVAIIIGDECLKYLDTFKYLGFVFSKNHKDDADWAPSTSGLQLIL